MIISKSKSPPNVRSMLKSDQPLYDEYMPKTFHGLSFASIVMLKVQSITNIIINMYFMYFNFLSRFGFIFIFFIFNFVPR